MTPDPERSNSWTISGSSPAKYSSSFPLGLSSIAIVYSLAPCADRYIAVRPITKYCPTAKQTEVRIGSRSRAPVA
jgi:hypothetical protein